MTASFAELPRPFAVAHRSGNSIEALTAVSADDADVIEADVWLHHGRLEMRHMRTVGPLPIYWDRWFLKLRWAPRLFIAEMLQAMPPGVALMLDLKGSARRLPSELVAAVREAGVERVSVCSRNWQLLDPFEAYPEIAVVHSIGREYELRRAWERLEADQNDAVTLHARLLTRETVQRLKAKVSTVMTWPVNDEGALELALDCGVDGMISDDRALLRSVISTRSRSRSA